MSNTAIHNLSKEKMQQILTSIGSKMINDDKNDAEAVEYNWQQPHCFTNSQLKKLDSFTKKVAKKCTQKFSQLCHNDFDVKIVSTTQHFADELTENKNAQNEYYLAIGSEDQTFGMVSIPGKAAIVWAAQLLGDSKSAEDLDRTLTQLEQSILFDLTAGIIDALSNSCDDYELQPASEIVGGQMPIEFEGDEELCKITLSVKKTDSEDAHEIYFLIFCDKLQTIVEQKVEINENISPKEISKAMLDYVRTTPVSVTAQLASISLDFEKMMNLQVDDIILLGKGVGEPIELIVEGQTFFRGRSAKSDGKYAVVITERCNKK